MIDLDFFSKCSKVLQYCQFCKTHQPLPSYSCTMQICFHAKAISNMENINKRWTFLYNNPDLHLCASDWCTPVTESKPLTRFFANSAFIHWKSWAGWKQKTDVLCVVVYLNKQHRQQYVLYYSAESNPSKL